MKYLVVLSMSVAASLVPFLDSYAEKQIGHSFDPGCHLTKPFALVATWPTGQAALPLDPSWPIPATVSAALVDLPIEAFSRGNP